MRKMTIIGIILIAAGLLIGIGLFGGGMTQKISKDPANSNEAIITGSGDTTELGSGVHKVWYKGLVSGPITARGPDNSTYTVKDSSIDEEYDDIVLFGDFKADEKGEYRFEYTGTGDLYITEDFSVSAYDNLMYGGIGGGVLILIIGIVLTVIGIKRQKSRDHSSFFQDAPVKEPETTQGPIDEGTGGP